MSEIDLFFETMDSDFYHIYVTHAAELFKNLFQNITILHIAMNVKQKYSNAQIFTIIEQITTFQIILVSV